MKRRTEFYAAIASRRFLTGTPYHSPFEAVKAGARSIEDWCDCLGQTRSASGWTDDDVQSGQGGNPLLGPEAGLPDGQNTAHWEG